MKIELNDETLTAYALGELDAAETKAVEKLLADAANAGIEAPRKTLEEIRSAIRVSEAAFAETATDAALTGEQRASVQGGGSIVRAPRFRVRRMVGTVAALAATFLLIAALMPSLARSREAASRASKANEAKQLALMNEIAGRNGVEQAPVGAAGVPLQTQERLESLGYAQPSAPASGAPATSAGNGLQSVQSGGGLRIRGNFYSEDDVRRAAENRTAGAVAATEAGAANEPEQLRALGYVEQAGESFAWRGATAGIPLQGGGGGGSGGGGVALGLTVQPALPSIAEQTQVAAIDDYRYRREPRPVTPGTESYKQIIDGGFIHVMDQPLSTFSIDVDTASYANVRRYLEQGQLPPADAVRVEELINYFDYAYSAPTDGRPFSAHFEAAACPWAPEHTLVRIGLKGREVPRAERPASNLVFLIDVSGSMQPENKLPLVKRAMAMLTRQLDERDRVTIVTYASGVNLALRATNASQQDVILGAIESLGAGGSTNGAGGIQLAYESARRNFLPGGVNRVILATDGDFNVGISDNDSLLALIQQEARSGVFLSVFGFGMGNLKDDKLEMLADKGNGVYGYIDSESEARKVFVEKLSGTLVTIAKDVKIQVEFNPARAAAYRLIGYENRALAAQDFNDDRKDAGEIGAGHTVTALYEVVPAGMAIPAGSVDPLRYQGAAAEAAARVEALAVPPAHADELLHVKLRYKEPEGAASMLLEFPLKDRRAEAMSADLKFASAVSAFGKLLRGNALGPALTYDGMMQLAQAGLAGSDDPRRAEMIHLMLTARPMIEGQPGQRRYVN